MSRRFNNTGRYVADPANSKSGAQAFEKGDPSDKRLETSLFNDKIDARYGFERCTEATERVGFMVNFQATEILDEDKRLIAALDCYFLEENGTRFKISVPFKPYLYVLVAGGTEQEISSYLLRKYQGYLSVCEMVMKEDLDLLNHLSGLKQQYIKCTFSNTTDLQKVRRELLPIVKKNKLDKTSAAGANSDVLKNILDMREHDVPYHVRVSIDLKLFVGLWYTVKVQHSKSPIITRKQDLLATPDICVLAYDIETSKLPLKFPDSASDQIMMISYMIDGHGYLITNKEIVSENVEDFEYTPKPEFQGQFTIFNEENENALLVKFFDHILDVQPLVIATYNGDNFDWMFVEARANFHKLDMNKYVGWSRGREGFYLSRACIHMDCLHWVKRDSYLPVGSQNLKAVAKAKLRYDPVELDPELMVAMAQDNPQVLANYSVSDAVATYYLYMKYVHPFIFALCTIIPTQPDEVLRKGSGTLCESLLMVKAFEAEIIYPNKQENIFNKISEDGHVLDQETYVGGHVEALESGVFRADIPCRFRLVPQAFQKLIDEVDETMKRAITVEESIPFESVQNFDEVCTDIKTALAGLRDCPNRLEKPIIYHLDVGAMYPNIILTNRLQPSAMVDVATCAACDYNRPGERCQRTMEWTWRGEMMPATRAEFQRIQQQLETETFVSPINPKKRVPFHELSDEDRAAIEKKRLQDYCRRAYSKIRVTKTQLKKTTICQRENSFYVDTVRQFRDRRYEFKGLLKKAKGLVNEAVKRGDAAEIKSAKNLEILYDSLQLAHKCILNSFYGYVMRRGARWYSMEMAGIVCHTGAGIIMKARELIEQIGRPLELDTDGIWCVLPASFPENFEIRSSFEKKPKVVISYPGAILNIMVQKLNTNDQYHELVDPVKRKYEIREENSIFFEVDGPYLAMVLPASKEEGKKLKKRYAVFNFDGSLAELKGFEVKRRGELQLIKIFQSSVFEAFLKGENLEECYASVAKIADYWLDVLYSRASTMPDEELFDLISENRSMSKKLEDYGAQKSTSISTARRLAEFLGDQMVKDAGLSCRYVIAKKPEGAPVTERAIPLAIFHAEPSVRRHFLRKWLKCYGDDDLDIRSILDWTYYIERLGSAIQKIITIPAALQQLRNPVPRVPHPSWLHKKLLEKDDVLKQKRINELFTAKEKDIEDMCGAATPSYMAPVMAVSHKRSRHEDAENIDKNWREILGPPPSIGETSEDFDKWLTFHKNKWTHQKLQRDRLKKLAKRNKSNSAPLAAPGAESQPPLKRAKTCSGLKSNTLGGFLKKAQQNLLNSTWQIVQIVPAGEDGVFKVWVLIGNSELRQVRVGVPRIFYVNQRVPKDTEETTIYRKVMRHLPRAHPVHHLYEYAIDESVYINNNDDIAAELGNPYIEGIYETQVPLDFRLIVSLGCLTKLDKRFYRQYAAESSDFFDLRHLEMCTLAETDYLEGNHVKYIFLYQNREGHKQVYALFIPSVKKAWLSVVDSVVTDQLPNLNVVYNQEREAKIARGAMESLVPDPGYVFESSATSDVRSVHKLIQKHLQQFLGEKRGPTILVVQSRISNEDLTVLMPQTCEFPIVRLHVQDSKMLDHLQWQRVGSKAAIRHFLNVQTILTTQLEQCRYLHVPLGNLPADATRFGCDVFYARNLLKQNFLLWCSRSDRPDLGGKEADDNRSIEHDLCLQVNNEGMYTTTCVELDLQGIFVTTILQAHTLAELEGISSNIAFDAVQAQTVQDMVSGGDQMGSNVSGYDESSQCAGAFRILRQMVSAFMKDVAVYQNIFADQQLSHLFRWLKDPHSLLFEPSLKRILDNLISKMFNQLVAEFQRLGSHIVHASLSKIILCTKRKTIEDASAYVEFVVNSMRNKELFHSVDFSVKQAYKILLWMDPSNHGGVQRTADDSEDEVRMLWNMSKFLSTPSLTESFNMTVGGYINALFQHLEQTPPEQNSVEYIQTLIREEFSQSLMTLTHKLHEKYPTGEFPKNALMKHTVARVYSPSLEFVKMITRVLSVDQNIAQFVNSKLKRDLLKLCGGVGAFSESAIWHDPCLSFVLSQVICTQCNCVRDLDVCRDTYTANGQWFCPQCESLYEMAYIESLMVDSLQVISAREVLQDLQCTKCNMVKEKNMSRYCECAGYFKNMTEVQNTKELLDTFATIATAFKMDILLEHVKWTRSVNQCD
ncbi:DNA polymerase epsilon catalytic subunit A [Galendromus occidentalis]|uniref:DNA polymerase epsilon catalytic subunit n=1 Tax=Galendromus occidentalis TaxID=34638 RepID=A0AAJ7L5S6_9ACAR|nr:DNA polymerase epsilon catalytic subunit A [Galendromus occidentalis]